MDILLPKKVQEATERLHTAVSYMADEQDYMGHPLLNDLSNLESALRTEIEKREKAEQTITRLTEQAEKAEKELALAMDALHEATVTVGRMTHRALEEK